MAEPGPCHHPAMSFLSTALHAIARRAAMSVAVLVFMLPTKIFAEIGLQNCAEQFPESSVLNAPTTATTDPDDPAPGNAHVCKRKSENSFFAMEYDTSRFTAAWVAYRLDPASYGSNQCNGATRMVLRCHFKDPPINDCVPGKRGKDPFHEDSDLLAEHTIKHVDQFKSTQEIRALGDGNDRGHLAPGQAMSWHACGWYKSFTMANMAPQLLDFNQRTWLRLEQRVLFWATINPIYVVSGPTYGEFPTDRFDVFEDGFVLSGEQLSVDTDLMIEAGVFVDQEPVPDPTLAIPHPTGYFKVIYQLQLNGDSAQAIAFLLPHTKQKPLPFEPFVSTVAVVEEVTGLRFAIPDSLKTTANLSDWPIPPSGWKLGSACPTDRQPVGWMADLEPSERTAICEGD